MAECPTLVEDDEEFLMDTDVHRMILDQMKYITPPVLKPPPFCGQECEGKYNANKGRSECLKNTYCDRG
ncbi:hypothetical protein Hanom_Chr11g01052731 [Helianthus anomalus]